MDAAYYLNPAVSWIFILGIILGVALHLWSKGHVENMVDRALTPTSKPVEPMHDGCPCTTDRNYHEWVALMLVIEDESRDQEDHR
jgi:hypothetical protein